MNAERLLARFLRYVQVDTTAREGADEYPSSPGQWELGRLLVEELQLLGLQDAHQTERAIVLATLPPTVPHPVDTIALSAHLDTSPETTGANVRPQVIRHYPGGDIPLPANPNQVIRVESNPELEALVGKTLITTDGSTLLGADDKAGIAAIMEAVAFLSEHPELPRGPVRICFTCDEEIGRGVDFVDLASLGATVAYTLDGSAASEIDVETFSANLATVVVRGVNIHPSIAKDRMVNAVRAAADFLKRLPHDALSPETTSDREGFLHPYAIEGGVAEVSIRILLRDFDTPALDRHAELLRRAARQTEAAFPGASLEVHVRPQYRNMADGLPREPRAVEYAEQAHRNLNRAYRRSIIRGGTDGSRFTALGLPTPNLSTGEHNPHSTLEWTCLEEMVAAAEHLVELVQVWARGGT